MFRTRDFILVLLVVGFLVVAILATISTQNRSQSETVRPNPGQAIVDVTAVAVETDSAGLNREERLLSLREKIAESELTSISAAPSASEPPETVDATATTTGHRPNQPLFCPNHQPLVVTGWPATDLRTDTREGVRVYYTISTSEATTTATTSQPIQAEKILLQLPTQFVPLGQPTCLPTDVIGVALDGSLIRNQETNLYQLFSADTLIGYALDGFPIYGTGATVTDKCGGRIVQGQYRYELSESRDTILNCFSGTPQSLPQSLP